jgi:hypothetical protein
LKKWSSAKKIIFFNRQNKNLKRLFDKDAENEKNIIQKGVRVILNLRLGKARSLSRVGRFNTHF